MGSWLFIGLAMFALGGFIGVMVQRMVHRFFGDRTAIHARLQSEELQKQSREIRDQAKRLEELETERIRLEAEAAAREASHREQLEQLSSIRNQIGEKLELISQPGSSETQTKLAEATVALAERSHQEQVEQLTRFRDEILARLDSVAGAVAGGDGPDRVAAENERSHREQVEELARFRQEIVERLETMAREARSNGETLIAEAVQRLSQARPPSDGDDHSRSDAAIATLIQPITETLARFDEKLAAIASDRREQLGAIAQHLEQVARVHAGVRDETQRLADALQGSPKAFGHWGEQKLRRILELAGMLPYVDLVPVDETGAADPQPDAILRLPGDRRLAIDGNLPTAAFLRATEAPDRATEERALDEHAAAVRRHLETLGGDAYRRAFAVSPELVVMYMPAENLMGAALARDPALFEDGVKKRVLMATPTTLIALARAIAHSWEQERSVENVRELAEIGAELYERMAQISEQVEELGRGLETSVRTYNSVIGDLQGSVMAPLRRLRELAPGAGKRDLADPQALDVSVRAPRRRRSFVITQAGQEAAAAISRAPEGPPVPAPARAMAPALNAEIRAPEPKRPSAAPVDPF